MSSKDPKQVARKQALFRLVDSFKRKNIDLALQLVKSDRSLYQAAKDRYYPMLRTLDPQLGQGLKLLYRAICQRRRLGDGAVGNRSLPAFGEDGGQCEVAVLHAFPGIAGEGVCMGCCCGE